MSRAAGLEGWPQESGGLCEGCRLEGRGVVDCLQRGPGVEFGEGPRGWRRGTIEEESCLVRRGRVVGTPAGNRCDSSAGVLVTIVGEVDEGVDVCISGLVGIAVDGVRYKGCGSIEGLEVEARDQGEGVAAATKGPVKIGVLVIGGDSGNGTVC